jgi:hypothetical protein
MAVFERVRLSHQQTNSICAYRRVVVRQGREAKTYRPECLLAPKAQDTPATRDCWWAWPRARQQRLRYARRSIAQLREWVMVEEKLDAAAAVCGREARGGELRVGFASAIRPIPGV